MDAIYRRKVWVSCGANNICQFNVGLSDTLHALKCDWMSIFRHSHFLIMISPFPLVLHSLKSISK